MDNIDQSADPGPSDDGGNGTEQLRDWWLKLALIESIQAQAKADEYGSGDLEAIGRVLARCQGDWEPDRTDAMKLGVYFYLLGKMARFTESVIECREVNPDTIHDILIYARMYQRICQTGDWP